MNLFSRALSSVLVGLVPSYRIGGMVTVIVNPPPPRFGRRNRWMTSEHTLP